MAIPDRTPLIGRANHLLAAGTFDDSIEVHEAEWEHLSDADYTLYQWMYSFKWMHSLMYHALTSIAETDSNP